MREHDEGIQQNRNTIAGNLECYRDHYWDLYERYGFTFTDGYRAWLLEFYMDANRAAPRDDDDEPWKG